MTAEKILRNNYLDFAIFAVAIVCFWIFETPTPVKIAVFALCAALGARTSAAYYRLPDSEKKAMRYRRKMHPYKLTLIYALCAVTLAGIAATR